MPGDSGPVMRQLPEPARTWLTAAIEIAHEKGGTDIVVIDVTDRLPLTDAFLLITVTNARQAGALVDALTDGLAVHGAQVGRGEGRQAGRWVLMDAGAVIIHVMCVEERLHYALERLWKDCPMVTINPPALPRQTG